MTVTTSRTSLSVLAMLFFYFCCCCCTSPSSVYGWCSRSSSTSTSTTTKNYSSVRGRDSLIQQSLEPHQRRLTARYLNLDDNEAVCGHHEDGEDLSQLSTNSIRASSSRRSFLTRSLSLSMVTAGYTLSSSPSSASAASSDGGALFRPNPLTNGLLEQIRIWEQAEADNIKYGGELERGDAGNKGQVSAYPRLLMPILVYATELKTIQQLVRKNSIEAWTDALRILQQPSYDKVTFKKTFNKYGDNIYYSDPDRANLYLGGGATPRTEQSLAYLLRNDVLTNVENLTAELEYLIKNQILDETEDLYQYADIAVSAMMKYLAIVPPNELEEAQRILVEATGERKELKIN